MATLTLRNVPDELEASLKARVKRYRRSLNNETFAALVLAGCNGDRGHVCAGCRVC